MFTIAFVIGSKHEKTRARKIIYLLSFEKRKSMSNAGQGSAAYSAKVYAWTAWVTDRLFPRYPRGVRRN